MFYFISAAALCTIDLIAKKYIQKKNAAAAYLHNHGIVKIIYFKNKGAMLGFLKNSGRLLLGITMTVIGFLMGILAVLTRQKGQNLLKTGLSLILGGALSNAYERIKDGEVTDYISFNAGPKKFRNIVFNIGDFSIFGGCALTVIHAFKKH